MCHVTDPLSGKGAGTIMQNANGLHGLHGMLDPGGYFSPQTNPAAAAQLAAEQAQQTQIQKTIDQINSIFTSPARQAQYKDYYNSTLATLKNSLNQNYVDAQRGLKFGLARTGNIGSSNDVYQHGLLSKDYQTGILNADTQAQGAEAQLENADSATQSALDSMALNGGLATNPVQTAQSDAAANLQQAQGTVAPATFDQLFGDISTQYLNQMVTQGQQAANAADLTPNNPMPSASSVPAAYPSPWT